jgi:hypothetical protein
MKWSGLFLYRRGSLPKIEYISLYERLCFFLKILLRRVYDISAVLYSFATGADFIRLSVFSFTSLRAVIWGRIAAEYSIAFERI